MPCAAQKRAMASQQHIMARYTPFAAYAFKEACASQIRFKLQFPFQEKEVRATQHQVVVGQPSCSPR